MSAKIGDIEYETLKDALSAAAEGDEVILTSDEALDEDLTIPSGIRVTIPTGADAEDSLEGGNTGTYTEGSACVTLMVPEGITLTVEGTLLAAGNQYCQNPDSGKLTGDYGAIQLDGAISVSGSLYARGEVSGSGTVAVEDGGALYERFEIDDFPGGTLALERIEEGESFPFHWWGLGGCSCACEIREGGSLIGQAYCAGISAEAEICGEDGLLQGGPVTLQGSTLTASGSTVLSSLSISISGSGMDSSDFILPVPWSITVEGSLELEYPVKLLPGAVLTVDGVLTADEGLYLYSADGYESNWNARKYHPGESARMAFGEGGAFSGEIYSTDPYLYNIEGYRSCRDEDGNRITSEIREYNHSFSSYEDVSFILGTEGDSDEDYENRSGELLSSGSSTSGVMGYQIVDQVRYRSSGGAVKPAEYRMIGENGKIINPSHVLVVADGGYSLYWASAWLQAGKACTIIASVVPADAQVYFSLGSGDLSKEEELEGALFAVGTPDSSGLCQFVTMGTGDTLYAWIRVWTTAKTQNDYGITLTVLETADYVPSEQSDEENDEEVTEEEDSSSDSESTGSESSSSGGSVSGVISSGSAGSGSAGSGNTSSKSTGSRSTSTGGSSSESPVTAEQEDGEEAGILTIYTGTFWETVEASADTGYVVYHFSGTAPGNAEAVFLSRVDEVPDEGEYDTVLEMFSFLSDGVILSTEPEEDGSFAFEVKDEYNYTGYLVVWCCCLSGSGGLTVSLYCETGTCLSGDTLIAMASGPAKPLCEVQAGDRVLAGNYEATRVTRVSRGVYSGTHTRYVFSDGTVIDETHPHRFFNLDQGFWQLLERWKPGERARKRDGTTPALVSRETREEKVELFGIWTEARTYWANGLLSGETAANEMLLGEATIEQAAAMAASLTELGLERILEEAEK